MALELKDLTNEERLALVALIGLAVVADRSATEPELKQVQATVAALGKKAYQAAAEEADERFAEESDLWTFLATIKRPEAREVIYEAVLQTVLADAPRSEETAVVERLAKLWHIQSRIVDPPK